MHPRIAELTGYLQRTREALEQTAAAIPDDLARRRPAPDVWSPAELLHHLAAVESSISRLLAKLLAQAVDAGIGAEAATDSVLGRLDRYRIESGEPRIVSPERLRPPPDADPAESLVRLRGLRAELHRLLSAADGLAVGTIRAPHPALGELDFYEWVLFIGQHEERHRRQIEAGLASLRGAEG